MEQSRVSPKRPRKDRHIGFRIDRGMMDDLMRVSAEQDVPKTELVRRAIRRVIAEADAARSGSTL